MWKGELSSSRRLYGCSTSEMTPDNHIATPKQTEKGCKTHFREVSEVFIL
jgi:hypothetical protein